MTDFLVCQMVCSSGMETVYSQPCLAIELGLIIVRLKTGRA